MKEFFILIVAIAAAVVVWKWLTKKLRAKEYHGAVVGALGGLGSVFAFLLTLGILMPEQPKKPEAQAAASVDKSKADKVAAEPAVKPAAAPEAKPAAKPETTPAPQEEKVALQKTLGLSTAKLVGDIEILKRAESPLRDGTRREILTINQIMTLEAIGDPGDLSRYTLVFGVPNDDKVALMTNAVYAAGIFANTYPQWNGKKDNAMNWFGEAMRKLTKNIEKNRNEPKPVKLERDDKKVELSAIPTLGMVFLSVEPID
ncbi:hypothetical protein [Chromobacterium violaceum]|uniref:hypothetical protein n=1 Tax=Chromobacterium violaceum TaxID=536 RepID=UPI0005BC702D|nr:hypothetical protein [Chromobacterium violaceum]